MMLDNNDLEYELIKRFLDDCVQIKFTGFFNGEQIIWHATIRTLNDYFKNIVYKNLEVKKEIKLKQFIDVRKDEKDYKVDVVLNLKAIDEASIKRTIIMIRQYKRLHVGRHEYGEPITFNFK